MTELEKKEIYSLFQLGLSKTKIAKKTGYSYSTVCRILSNKNKDSMINQRFGRLTVIENIDKPDNVKSPGRYYRCRCDCGKEAIVRGQNLRDEITKSCGCLAKESGKKTIQKAIKANTKDITGLKYGMLTALYSTDKRSGTSVVWHCQCECGNECDVGLNNLKRGNVKSCGCLVSIGEQKISKLLLEYKINFLTQYSFNDLYGDKNLLRFDFAILDNDNSLLCLIEFQGEQHYIKSNSRHTELLERYDKYKVDYCSQHNILLYKITKEDDLEEKVKGIMTNHGLGL